MKIIGIAVVRTGSDLNEPIPLTVANDLSSFGFFQRQVCCECPMVVLQYRTNDAYRWGLSPILIMVLPCLSLSF
jgi:hypothetical protein